MFVTKYIPDKLFGFLEGSIGEVFFHLGVFRSDYRSEPFPSCLKCLRQESCYWVNGVPPPILGESVDVEIDLTQAAIPGKAPRALSVVRLTDPVAVHGRVESFDHLRGFGFVRGDNQSVYHLHRSEVQDGKIPLVGQSVVFYAGIRQGKPRACHVKVCAT